jgi:hypothetical protein
MTLASRQPAARPAETRPAARPYSNSALAGIFQRVAPIASGLPIGGVAGGGTDPGTIATHLSLPPGFSVDSLSESVTAYGSSGQTNDAVLFGARLQGAMAIGSDVPGLAGQAVRPGEAVPGAAPGAQGGAAGAAGGGGALGALGGAFGSGGGSANELTGMLGLNGPGGALGQLSRLASMVQSLTRRPHGIVSYDFGGSPLSASPYSLTPGHPVPKPEYLQHRFTATIGGLLKVPHLFDAGPRTSFFLNYSGNRSSNAYSQYSTVPTLAERGGDFSSVTTPLLDPVTHQPFTGNQLPGSRIDPAALSLLRFIPEPNLPGDRLNFHYSTTSATSSDDINFRLIRSFGGNAGGRGRGAGANGRPGAGGRGAGAGGLAGLAGLGLPGMGGSMNLNIGFHYHRSTADQQNPFPTIAGISHQTGWDIPVGFGFSSRGVTHSITFQFNGSHSQTANGFAFARNVAGEAGIQGVASDPFDWGVPSLSFSSISSLRDITPSLRRDQTLAFGDSMVKTIKRHALRFGGNFRDTRIDSRTDASARGSYVFTGLYTGGGAPVSGSDFADFLLGMPQQASVQYGPGLERFRSRSWALYFQDDWRVSGKFTVNAGVRYEYQSPYSEAGNRLVSLDVTPDFSAAVPVQAGQVGPFTGRFPVTIVAPDRNNASPRIGVAWKPQPKTTVRGGYSINYASVPYMSFAQQLAAQPPFAVTDTRFGTAVAPLLLTDAFGTPIASTTTNNFGVDRNYRLGYVQLWNVDVQRDLGRTFLVGVAYTGTKGSQLDLQRAPNRGPSGLRIAGVQPFIWESSGGRSIMHALSLRVTRRLAQGISGTATYTYSKSMDNASTLGGGSTTVAQNDQDLAAEWGPSNFDQRHRLTANFTYELPFGPTHRWLSGKSLAGSILGGWILTGNVSIASGLPFTARVLGDVTDVARGTNGTLRADYNGAPIAIADPTVLQFFNTAAFSIPAAGTFGNAGRNTITGPGSAVLNLSVMKSISLATLRGMSIRVQANNVLNTPQFSAIDTVFNSPTFGRVTAVRSMRSVQVVARLLF